MGDKERMEMIVTKQGWIGFDLDGTLALYGGWKGMEHIGEPIEPMMTKLRAFLEEGYEVRIMTARAFYPRQVPYVHDWLEKHGLPRLGVTNVKDFGMITLYDDRCVQVGPNTGSVIGDDFHG